ncbi:MAG: alpha-ketoacid dehydrogenase subunit beta, partial [Patescibacteria group bacterium]|nr:alpha-ketoacid dehydrogenase subunit beta [Patescibacteria group bacterium]
MPQELYYWEALNQALKEEMNRDPLVFCMGEGIGQRGGSFKVTTGLWEEFGSERIMDTPLSEASFTGAGVGAAIIGTRPVVEIMFIDFTALILDQIVNQAAKYNFMSGGKGRVPLVLRTQGGCGNGIAAQHSQSLESWYYHIPGLKVVMPATPADAKGLLKTSIRDDDPVIFIEHKRLYQTKGLVPIEEYLIPLGKADIKRSGKDVTIVTYSLMTLRCLEAAEQLASEGIDAEIIDLRSIYPMDKETILSSVKKTNKLVI